MNTHHTLAGIGLRSPYVTYLMQQQTSAGWLEVHPENYMGSTAALGALLQLRRRYPIAFHCVGLSLGSASGLSLDHLERVATLAEQVEPMVISDHLSWSSTDGIFLNDLLPLPYTREALDVVCTNVDRGQERLRRTLLVENPSSYMAFCHSEMTEAEFLNELVRRTGCGVLLDVNNLHVSCANVGGDPFAYLESLSQPCVAEIHLAGHAVVHTGGGTILIDDHGSLVADAVWSLYRAALDRFGAVRTLVEWDSNLPPIGVLLNEACRAAAFITLAQESCHDIAA